MKADQEVDWRPRRLIIALAAVVLVAVAVVLVREARWAFSLEPPPTSCAKMNGRKSQGVIFTDPTAAKADPALFCSCLSDAARRTSSSWLNVTVIVGLFGMFLTLLGGALGPPPGAAPGTLVAERGILCAGVGALMLVFAAYANSRASSASNVAADAHSAIALPPRQDVRSLHPGEVVLDVVSRGLGAAATRSLR